MTENNKSASKKIFIGIIIAIILIVSGVVVYGKVIKPKMYDKYIISGSQYLEDRDYGQGIEYFKKAIKIDSNSIDARFGLAQCYIRINEVDKAVQYLKEVQNIDNGNEELTMQIVDMLKSIDEQAANEFIKNFIDQVGISNVSEKFRTNILESTDKNELNKHIDRASNLYDNSVEGSLEGQYRVGSKEELLNSIDVAKKIANNYLASQDEVNNEVSTIQDAIIDFERGKVKAMPDGIGNKYITRLMAIESEVESCYDNLDLSNAEMGDIVWNALSKYESVMNDIYTDLNTYLPSDKKSQLSGEKQKYQNERAQAQAEFDQALAESFGTWGVTGEPDALGNAVKKHCYYLINKYMQ